MDNNLNQFYDNDEAPQSDINAFSGNNTEYTQTSTADLQNDSFARVAYDYSAYEYEDDTFSAQMEQKRRSSNKKCTISLILMFGAPMILGIFSIIFRTLTGTASSLASLMGSSGYSSANSVAATGLVAGAGLVNMLIYAANGACTIAAIVLMIVARVQYPEGVFGKVVMWIYIARYVLTAILVVFILIIIFVVFGVAIFSII